jgi:outer membrane protein assembly factor BamB
MYGETMNKIISNRRRAGFLLTATVAWFAVISPTSVRAADAPSEEALAAASRIVQSTGVPGGICSVVGRTDANLALALAKQGSFQVHCLVPEPEDLDRIRRDIRSHGSYGTVSATSLDPARLPYTDNLVNIVAPLGWAYLGDSSSSGGSRVWVDELSAQLRAAGIEQLSVVDAGGTWVRFQKPWPAEIDEWTHYLHGADGNPVAQDDVVGPPKHYQWISDPLWLRSHETDSSVSTLVTAAGRLYYIVDEAPISLVGPQSPPDKWSLVAQDAFNGVVLWKVPIRRWGWREWKPTWFTNRPGDFPLNIRRRLVATGDKVYVTLGYRAPVSELDARTGEILKTFAGTEGTGEILYLDGTLVLSVVASDGVKVMAVDADSGNPIWTTDKSYRGSVVDYIKFNSRYDSSLQAAKLDPALNIATDGKVVALIDGPQIVGLDFGTGQERWRSGFPTDDADRTAGGIQAQDNLWNGTMITAGGVVLHASPSRLAALSADSGELLWSQPKKYIGHLWYEWKDVFVIDDLVWTWSSELDETTFGITGGRKQHEFWPKTINAYDLTTGHLEKAVPLGVIFKTHHHHRCYRDKATTRYILASRRGTEYVDLQDGNHSVHNWIRGTCHVGMMPANGLQYAPPHPCQCYVEEKLNGMNAVAAARPADLAAADQASRPDRLQCGPAFQTGASEPSSSGDRSSADWPAFRHDSRRTGSVDTRVPDDAAPLWQVALGGKISPPIVADGRLFVALVDEHHVACLDAQSGDKLWEFAAGGRIDSPPTYHNGTVLFGSRDGWVYCLRAADGQLAWRFRAAPEERLIGAFGQLESAWPVHGSVLVENDTVYFAAGRTSQLDGGISLYGLDAASGKLLHQTKLEGPDYATDSDGNLIDQPAGSALDARRQAPFDDNYRLPTGSLPDVLLSDGSKIHMRSETFDMELNRQPGQPLLQTGSGLLEDSYFKRMPWTFGGPQNYARLLVHDDRSLYGVRMFDTLRGLDPTVYFTPGAKGYLLFAKSTSNRGGDGNAWSTRIPIRGRAMVLTADRLFVAGPPDVIDPKDPLGAFEGRKGGLLYTIDSVSGEKRAEHTLSSPPVFNGTAAADGRLYIADEDGHLTCFGK